MGALAGYIATFCAGVLAKYAEQFLRPKVKIRYWLSHNFLYTIPPAQLPPNPAPALPAPAPAGGIPAGPPAAQPNFLLLTQSLTVQNFGRERAEWVEIVHRRKPDFYQLHPALNFTEDTTPTGEHSLRVQSLASQEYFTVQFLSYTHMPELLLVRSNAGHALPMPWMVVRRFPRWAYQLMWLAMAIGVAFCAYWVIKGAIFVLKSVGAL
jgi:hypothetical protein